MGIFKVTRETKIVLTGVLVVSFIGIMAAFIYYRGINRSEDPRILPARYMLARYDEHMKAKNYQSAFPVLDSIEVLLLTIPGYSGSYEWGIVWNNRASVYISKALYEPGDSLLKPYLLDTASLCVQTCIDFYLHWIGEYGKIPEKEIHERILPFFRNDDDAFQGFDLNRIRKKRVKDILLAQKEVPRRLSVAYTNLGIIQRHTSKPTEAAESYRKALVLWKDNPAAIGNLNVLFGKPYKERSAIKKLFPPSRTN